MSRDSIESLLAHLAALAPTLRAHARAADRLAQLPEPVVRALKELRLFRLWIPRHYDGLELGLLDALSVYEAAARADGSVGWAVMIGAGGGLFAAHLEAAAADEIYTPADAVIAGSGVPDGRAERVPGGYRVSGRWRYASGAHYATTFTANCLVTSAGHASTTPDGQPLIRAMAFVPAQVSILSTWDALGMRGTGSHDIEVKDVFVPEQRSFSVFDPPRESGALYRLPFGVLTELPVTAVALGIAQHAIEAFAALARQKRGSGAGQPLADDAAVRAQYAQSHARWSLLRAGIHALAARVWQVAADGRALSPHQLAEITASCACRSCKSRSTIWLALPA